MGDNFGLEIVPNCNLWTAFRRPQSDSPIFMFGCKGGRIWEVLWLGVALDYGVRVDEFVLSSKEELKLKLGEGPGIGVRHPWPGALADGLGVISISEVDKFESPLIFILRLPGFLASY